MTSLRGIVMFVAIALFAAACGKSKREGGVDSGSRGTEATTEPREAVRDASASGADGGGDATAKKTIADPTDPYGHARAASRVTCSGVGGKHVAERDLVTSFVDGNDLLALVNRSPMGQLAPDWSPSDLVDLRNDKPLSSSECDKSLCLRKDSAHALGELLVEMKKRGFAGKVESAYRSYSAQCGTFLRWAEKGSFCDATEQSALPGHSQHQLGTTVDLFTEEWAKDERGVFREGFGCTPAGLFLQEHAWDFGFVMPYPIHPDDRHPKQKCVVRWDIPITINPRTGYRFEHWHIRYIGKDAALRFKKAWEGRAPGTPNEIALEQWLRDEKGLSGPDADLPVCDGCNCGACATLAGRGENACDKRAGALHVDAHGAPLAAVSAPTIASVKRGSSKKWKGRIVEVKVNVPEGVLTQPPFVGPDDAGYAQGASALKLAPYPGTEPRAYPPLAGAWVVAVAPATNDTGTEWPWRAALTTGVVGRAYNRANVLLPARPGSVTLKIPIPDVTKVRVVLLENGAPKSDVQTLDIAP